MLSLQTIQLLRGLAERYETAAFLTGDPSWFMHQVQGNANQETMAFLAASLSYGSRKQFLPKIQYLLDCSGGEPYQWLRDGDFEKDVPSDDRCFYRLYTNRCFREFLKVTQTLLVENGTIGTFVEKNVNDALGALRALTAYFAQRGSAAVVPKDTTSACKRLCMFLRWMVRRPSPVDLGLWQFISPASLIMPLDTHVLQEAQRLSLLSSTTANMNTALRLTETLREVFPNDPTKADFALFGLGVSNQ